jgi:molybdopterin converting factor small subunit
MIGEFVVTITVNFYGPLARWAGKKSFTGEGKTILEVFKSLESQIGKSLLVHLVNANTRELKSHFHVLLNGKDTELSEGLGHSVKDGDIITCVPPVGGG